MDKFNGWRDTSSVISRSHIGKVKTRGGRRCCFIRCGAAKQEVVNSWQPRHKSAFFFCVCLFILLLLPQSAVRERDYIKTEMRHKLSKRWRAGCVDFIPQGSLTDCRHNWRTEHNKGLLAKISALCTRARAHTHSPSKQYSRKHSSTETKHID